MVSPSIATLVSITDRHAPPGERECACGEGSPSEVDVLDVLDAELRVFDTCVEAIFTLDSDGVILRCNDTASELLTAHPAAAIGQPFDAFVMTHDADGASAVEMLFELADLDHLDELDDLDALDHSDLPMPTFLSLDVRTTTGFVHRVSASSFRARTHGHTVLTVILTALPKLAGARCAKGAPWACSNSRKACSRDGSAA